MSRTFSRIGAWLRSGVLLCSPLLILPAHAAGQSPAAGSPADDKAAPSHVVKEGGGERPLWIDSGRVADFASSSATGPVIRPAPTEAGNTPGGKSDTGAGSTKVSPIFLDAAGQPQALPGGVIVTLKQPLPEAQARGLLDGAGLVPVRQLGERMWLVDAPVGIESLQLAERLDADGRFDFVQPNWWRPRARK